CLHRCLFDGRRTTHGVPSPFLTSPAPTGLAIPSPESPASATIRDVSSSLKKPCTFSQFFYQSERAASHSSICGHVNFSAPLPAIMPIWPPLTFSNCLSLLLIFVMMLSDWHGGEI